MEESNRQKKIAGILQNDLATMLQKLMRDSGKQGVILSVTQVKVTVDLSLAKVYISVFPSASAQPMIEELNDMKPKIRHQMAQLTRNQFRKMPDLVFYLDDSLEYIDKIERAVKGEEDPIKNPDLLSKRKKK